MKPGAILLLPLLLLALAGLSVAEEGSIGSCPIPKQKQEVVAGPIFVTGFDRTIRAKLLSIRKPKKGSQEPEKALIQLTNPNSHPVSFIGDASSDRHTPPRVGDRISRWKDGAWEIASSRSCSTGCTIYTLAPGQSIEVETALHYEGSQQVYLHFFTQETPRRQADQVIFERR